MVVSLCTLYSTYTDIYLYICCSTSVVCCVLCTVYTYSILIAIFMFVAVQVLFVVYSVAYSDEIFEVSHADDCNKKTSRIFFKVHFVLYLQWWKNHGWAQIVQLNKNFLTDNFDNFDQSPRRPFEAKIASLPNEFKVFPWRKYVSYLVYHWGYGSHQFSCCR